MSRGGALFSAPAQAAQNRNLVEFKAGKMMVRENNWVHPDKRKGQAYVYQSEEGLMHFCWKDRNSGVVEDDLIVFPEDTEYKRVTQCKTGRVFILKFKNEKKYFLWMQEPKEDKDEEICKKVNDCLNNPPNLSSRNRAPAGGGVGGLAAADVHELLGSLNMTQNELMTLLSMGMSIGGGTGTGGQTSESESPSSTRIHSSNLETRPAAGSPLQTSITAGRPTSGSTAADSPSVPGGGEESGKHGGKIKQQDLHNILSSLNQGGALGAERGASIDLSELVNMETMKTLVSNPEIQARLRPHLPALPEGAQSDSAQKDIDTNIRSAQFRVAVKAFGAALQTGEMAPVIAQFNLGTKVNEAAQKGDIVAFAKALEEESKQKSKEGEEKMDED